MCARCAHGAAKVLTGSSSLTTGAQLDGCPGTFDTLPAVAAAVSRHRTLHGVSGGELKWPVMLDGGVRRGTDVVKALTSENNQIRVTGIIKKCSICPGECSATAQVAQSSQNLHSRAGTETESAELPYPVRF